MMKENIIKTLKEAMNTHAWVKLMFIYPNSKPIFNQGNVLEVYEDCFTFEDRYDGTVEFGVKFLEKVQLLEGGLK